MKKQTQKKRNPWKWAFFMVIGLIVVILGILVIEITGKPETVHYSETSEQVTSDPVFQLQLTKEQTNQLVNYYLEQFQTDSIVKYNFVLDDEALLNGTFNFWGLDLNFYLYLEPTVLENGEVQLKAKRLAIGNLSLPISQILSYLVNNYTLPSWIEVDSKQEIILLHLNQYKMRNGMHFNVEELDLAADNILISAYLPATE